MTKVRQRKRKRKAKTVLRRRGLVNSIIAIEEKGGPRWIRAQGVVAEDSSDFQRAVLKQQAVKPNQERFTNEWV